MSEEPRFNQESVEQNSTDWLDRTIGVGTQLLKNALPSRLTREVVSQQFEIAGPTTVFVKASGCRVTVRQSTGRVVWLTANLYVSAGLDVATQQDEAGIYIVILRKPVVGTVSRANVQITIPAGCDLVADLDRGDLLLQDLSRRITISGQP